MGIAMIMVIVFHFFCWIYNPLGPFNKGHIGVDIFLFLSGYGLCRSYEKKPLSIFYMNRLKRIYPIYCVSVLCIGIYLIYINEWEPSDVLLNLTTLGYYVNGGVNRFDWYLESLFTIYLAFPLLYMLGRSRIAGAAAVFLIAAIVLYYNDIDWWYDCLISRIWIFVLGIVYARPIKPRLNMALCVVMLLLLLPCMKYISVFLGGSLLALPIICIAIIAARHIGANVKRGVELFGKYSLEIYISNQFVMPWVYNRPISVPTKTAVYVIIQIVLGLALIYLNKFLQSRLPDYTGKRRPTLENAQE